MARFLLSMDLSATDQSEEFENQGSATTLHAFRFCPDPFVDEDPSHLLMGLMRPLEDQAGPAHRGQSMYYLVSIVPWGGFLNTGWEVGYSVTRSSDVSQP